MTEGGEKERRSARELEKDLGREWINKGCGGRWRAERTRKEGRKKEGNGTRG